MSHFKTKEQYQKFIAGWKTAANAEECKSKRMVCDLKQYKWDGFTPEEVARLEEKGAVMGRICGYDSRPVNYTIKDGAHYKTTGWLFASHHIMYNMLRGKDPKYGFAPITVASKQAAHESPWIGFVRGALHLEYVLGNIARDANNLGLGKIPRSSAATEFLKPFNGSITVADLMKIDKEELIQTRRFITNLTKRI